MSFRLSNKYCIFLSLEFLAGNQIEKIWFNEYIYFSQSVLSVDVVDVYDSFEADRQDRGLLIHSKKYFVS